MSRRPLYLLIVLALLAAILAALPSVAAASNCDPAHVRVAGNDVRVLPTGGDDTDNLQCALDMAAGMERGRVTLSAATYSTSFIDVHGFNGTLRGAGMDATRLQTVAEGVDCVTRLAETGFTHLMIFAGGDVTVRDLTIGVGGAAACAEPWFEEVDEEGFGVIAADVDALAFRPGIPVADECLPEGPVAGRVDNVRFEGSSPNYEGPLTEFTHIFHGVIAGGFFICPETRTFGDLTVTRSEFLGADVPIGIGLIDESSVQVADNHFDEVGVALNSWSHSDTELDFRSNTVLAKLAGVVLGANPDFVMNPHTATIRHNDIDGILFADGVVLVDFAAGALGNAFIEASVMDNEINLDDTEFGGITLVDAVGAEAHGNVIDGHAAAAIVLFGGRDSNIVRNDVGGFTADIAQIWLDAGTSDTFVRCASPADEVLDEGAGNTLVGCSLLDDLAALAAPEPAMSSDSVVAATSMEGLASIERVLAKFSR